MSILQSKHTILFLAFSSNHISLTYRIEISNLFSLHRFHFQNVVSVGVSLAPDDRENGLDGSTTRPTGTRIRHMHMAGAMEGGVDLIS